MEEQKITMQDVDGKETEIGVTITNEKSALEFVKSKRAISFLVWLAVTFAVTPLVKEAFPGFVFDTGFVIDRSSVLAAMLIGGYTIQDVAEYFFDAVIEYMNKE